MANKNNNLTVLPAWQTLAEHYAQIKNTHMLDWFQQDAARDAGLSLSVDELALDYSRNRLTNDTLQLLCQLADESGLNQHIKDLFAGEKINSSENRAVLHTALRQPTPPPIVVEGQDISLAITDCRQRLETLVTAVLNGQWTGKTGRPIQHIVNIGIGGSHLGPQMATAALKDFAISKLHFHFVASVDSAELDDVLAAIDPEKTLFIVSSKTFTTIETMTNAQTAYTWMQNKLGDDITQHHFLAVTANETAAIEFGIPKDNVFPLWNWVGGRYSIWSAISLPLMLMIGIDQFKSFQHGAYTMDQHFQTAPFTENMPVTLALLTLWYVSFFNSSASAIAPYSHRLRYFVRYMQQAEMESNGKSVSRDGEPVEHFTCPVIFGEEGSNGQHAYHQLLHQGQHFIPVDFILIDTPSKSNDHHHQITLASGLSQAQALLQGKALKQSMDELLAQGIATDQAQTLAPHRVLPGNRPSNIVHLTKLSPKNLGALIALYEHKIFVLGHLWNINSFDQWGVELGKQLLPNILATLKGQA